MKFTTLAVTLLTAASLSLAQNVYADGAISLSSVAEIDKVMMDKDGKKETKRMLAKKVAPDGEVIYTNTFKNISSKPAGNIVINNPIPQNMRYSVGSASAANTEITYSVDGGKTFTTEDKLTVTTKEGRTRPAAADDYTNIRWTYKGELAAGQSGTAVFKAVVK